MKELVFHLLAELLRTAQALEQRKRPAGLSSSIALQLNPCLAMLMALQSELHKLYDEETQSWVSGSSCGGSGTAAATDQGRFSTYFHALMEGCLAVAEVTLPTNMSVTASGVTSTTAPNLSDSSSSSSSSPGQTPQSPSLLSKRKKVKMKREKASSSGKRQSSRSVDSDPAVLSIGGSKPEDMLWFHRALTLLIILRHLTRKDPQGLGVTSDAIADACQALVGPTAHSRLLVISGIPTHLDEGIVRGAIRKACNAHGGVFKDEIYIPLQDEDPKKPKDKAEGSDGKAEPEKSPGFLSTDSLEVSTSSSLTPAMSISASASTSQASICSSQGISQTVSDLSVDPLPSGLELPIPPGLLEPHVVSSQESLDISLCSTGSLGSLGSLGEPLDNAEMASVSDVGSLYTVTSLDNQPLASRPIKGFAVVEVTVPTPWPALQSGAVWIPQPSLSRPVSFAGHYLIVDAGHLGDSLRQLSEPGMICCAGWLTVFEVPALSAVGCGVRKWTQFAAECRREVQGLEGPEGLAFPDRRGSVKCVLTQPHPTAILPRGLGM